MRITADIIDEEIAKDDNVDVTVAVQGAECPEVMQGATAKNYTSKYVTQKTDEYDALKNCEPECWLRKSQENNLKFWHRARLESGRHALRIQDLNNKFQKLNLSADSESLKIIKRSCEFAEAAYQSALSKMEETKAQSTNISQENPPAWMVEMLIKMKQEIKDEILEELCGYPDLELYEIPSALKRNEKVAQDEVIHHNVTCDSCDQNIRGIRYNCGNCSDYDLCAECESLPNIHDRNHIFLKMRYPAAVKHIFNIKRNKSLVPCAGDLLSSNNKNVGHHHRRLYEAQYLCDGTIPDGTVLAPSTRFLKCWKVMNCGKRVWSHDTKLQLIHGSAGLKPDCDEVDVPHLKPGEEGIVSVWFTTSAVPGMYRSSWDFCHKHRRLRQEIWCHIVVKDIQSEKLVEALQLPPDGLPDSKEQEVVTITKVLTAVKEEHDRGNMIPRKLAVKSHTATPTNTPFDLTPPKSPDHHAVNELKEVTELIEPSSSKSLEDVDAGDEGSVFSLSSSDSDAEFVVIPMPKCFNLSESISSQHISHLSQYLPPETVVSIKDLSTSEQKLATSQKIVIKSATFSAETVSQETGVPELSSQPETEQKILISHSVSADGSSSSEVSVIESGSSSPTGDQPIPEIHVAITNEPKSSDVANSEDIQREVKGTDDSNEEPQPSSVTFPKFPVEGITTIYEPMSNDRPEQPEQKTIQVLPEKLSAPINVAVSLFQTARGVISSLQHPARSNPGAVAVMDPMDQLTEMGFCNREQNEELLKKHKNDVAQVVAELVSMNDNDWYASRHTPPSPPDFFD